MRLPNLLAIVVLSLSLYSCSCEDVNLGKLEQTGELTSFLPAQGKNFFAKYGETTLPLSYHVPATASSIMVPVAKTGKSQTTGKGGNYDCIEYYAAEEKEYPGYIEGQCPFYLNQKYTKDVNQHAFNTIEDKEQVADVIEYLVGFDNKFPKTVTRGMGNYDNFMPYRVFTLAKNPEAMRYKRSDITQEFLPTVTLNGVQHQNVYHLYLNSPQYTEDEKYFNQYYPLDYPQGIYVKEGIGILKAYTATGKKLNVIVE
ncbi:hypothetical protein WG947_11135 [Pontibacter sp. H259]|uniref:hypothetical protein n=1 Tax=Pontibacter sp. H259 TaxID=3133421 RepID=UPI0030BBA6C2